MLHNYTKVFFITILFLCGPIVGLYSQNDNHCLQKLCRWDIGLFGTWINYEHPIAEQWSLFGDVGFNPIIFGGNFSSKGFGLSGRVSVGARYYYDRNIRIVKNKKLINNSGNFLQIMTDFQPPGFSYVSVNDRSIISELRFIPAWGGRRNIGNSRWSFEGRLGVGYSYILDDVVTERKHTIAYDIRLAIGYMILRNGHKNNPY